MIILLRYHTVYSVFRKIFASYECFKAVYFMGKTGCFSTLCLWFLLFICVLLIYSLKILHTYTIQEVNLELSPFMIFLNKIPSQTTIESHCFLNLFICSGFISAPSSRHQTQQLQTKLCIVKSEIKNEELKLKSYRKNWVYPASYMGRPNVQVLY